MLVILDRLTTITFWEIVPYTQSIIEEKFHSRAQKFWVIWDTSHFVLGYLPHSQVSIFQQLPIYHFTSDTLLEKAYLDYHSNKIATNYEGKNICLSCPKNGLVFFIASWNKTWSSYFVRTLLFSPCHFSSFSENTDDPYEQRYNTTQQRGRSTIECGFGRSKHKWRVMLRDGGGMRFMSPLQAGKCIMVCCALWNFVLKREGMYDFKIKFAWPLFIIICPKW